MAFVQDTDGPVSALSCSDDISAVTAMSSVSDDRSHCKAKLRFVKVCLDGNPAMRACVTLEGAVRSIGVVNTDRPIDHENAY